MLDPGMEFGDVGCVRISSAINSNLCQPILISNLIRPIRMGGDGKGLSYSSWAVIIIECEVPRLSLSIEQKPKFGNPITH